MTIAHSLKANEKFIKFMLDQSSRRVLDIGAGLAQHHSNSFKDKNFDVVTNDSFHPSDHQCDYLDVPDIGIFDGIWCSHVLEHQRNIGLFLDRIHSQLKDNGILAITVPPCKHEIVGGHVTIWNAGLLLYNLILSRFDCSDAQVLRYGYNISVVLKKRTIQLPKLHHDAGDILRLKNFFPLPVKEGFDGNIMDSNWST